MRKFLIIAFLGIGSTFSPTVSDISAAISRGCCRCWCRRAKPQSIKKECCGECGGKGVVLSGDGLALVPCPCPESCACKQGKQDDTRDVLLPDVGTITAPTEETCRDGSCEKSSGPVLETVPGCTDGNCSTGISTRTYRRRRVGIFR